jgi:ppGpp synthetase/RelA/SpoT-type nucleotidyltranferase
MNNPRYGNTQIDKLGGLLRNEPLTEEHLTQLDGYRRSFAEAYDHVVSEVRVKLALEPTGRPAKSTTAIVDKLQRESIRLSQMQDIAGCRIIVPDIAAQDGTLNELMKIFVLTVVDRRLKPSNGYRAVHAIVESKGKLIEIQLRTNIQHVWAEVSEKFADIVDPTIKYGGGTEEFRQYLSSSSALIARVEEYETKIAFLAAHRGVDQKLLDDMRAEVQSIKLEIKKTADDAIEAVQQQGKIK